MDSAAPRCDAFTTDRLRAREWHAAARATKRDLPTVVAGMLTEPVTRWLPPSWHGPYAQERAAEWIEARDAEGPVLLVQDRSTGDPLGLVLLYEEPTDEGVEVRLGYLLAEHAWGRGLGGELLEGFVAWCRARGDVRTIIGGVAPDNAASIRLLERLGFRPEAAAAGEDLSYRLSLRGTDQPTSSAQSSGTVSTDVEP